MVSNLQGAVVLVTGANGGLGQEFVKQALERGAAKVYATARNPRGWDDARIVPLDLDVTDIDSIARAAEQADDVTVVINNAGVYRSPDQLTTGTLEHLRETFETNFFGAVQLVREFAPILGRNGGGVLLDVHSALSWIGVAGSYSASKAAFWSATNSFRLELAAQGTHVLGLHLGYTDTPMIADIAVQKNDPADVVRAAFDGAEAGEYEVLADDFSAQVKAGLAARIEHQYGLPQIA